MSCFMELAVRAPLLILPAILSIPKLTVNPKPQTLNPIPNLSTPQAYSQTQTPRNALQLKETAGGEFREYRASTRYIDLL